MYVWEQKRNNPHFNRNSIQFHLLPQFFSHHDEVCEAIIAQQREKEEYLEHGWKKAAAAAGDEIKVKKNERIF